MADDEQRDAIVETLLQRTGMAGSGMAGSVGAPPTAVEVAPPVQEPQAALDATTATAPPMQGDPAKEAQLMQHMQMRRAMRSGGGMAGGGMFGNQGMAGPPPGGSGFMGNKGMAGQQPNPVSGMQPSGPSGFGGKATPGAAPSMMGA